MRRVTSPFDAIAVALRNGSLRRVELAWGAAIASEWIHFVALGVYAYRAGGAGAVGIAGLVRLLPAAVVAPVAVSAADRFDRARFLCAATALGAVALAGSAAAAFAGLDVAVYGFGAVVGLSSTLIRPTLQALLPSLAHTPEELIASNGATSTVESIGTLAGPLAAGILVSATSVGVVFAAAAALIASAALLLVRLRPEESTQLRGRAAGRRSATALRMSFAALGAVKGARAVFLLMILQTFVRGCLNVLIVVAAFRVFHVDAGGVGYMSAAVGVGGLVGAVAAMTFQRRRLAAPFALSLVLWGLPIALIAPPPAFVLALVLLGVVGAANSVEDVSGFTLLQRAAPDDALTGALGLFWGLAMGAVAVGSLVAPLVVHVVGPGPAFVIVGALLPVAAAASFGRLAELDRVAAPSVELALVERSPILAPLSLATKERLARKLELVDVAAGECVIREGDVGDRFYIVASGELDVDASGRHRRLGPDGCFGEIALLRDVPRTATVTAATASRLYALRREEFVGAVTGHPVAERAGRDVVDAQLEGTPV